MKKQKHKIDQLESTIKSSNPIVKFYSKQKLDWAMIISDVKPEDKILDFGAGAKAFTITLRDDGFKDVVAYDIEPTQTEVFNYMELPFKPTKIFVLDVFEHIPSEEIRKILRNFKKLAPKADLTVSIPKESWFWRLARVMLGKTATVPDHITPLKEIKRILNEEGYKLTFWHNYMFVSFIGKYKLQ